MHKEVAIGGGTEWNQKRRSRPQLPMFNRTLCQTSSNAKTMGFDFVTAADAVKQNASCPFVKAMSVSHPEPMQSGTLVRFTQAKSLTN